MKFRKYVWGFADHEALDEQSLSAEWENFIHSITVMTIARVTKKMIRSKYTKCQHDLY